MKNANVNQELQEVRQKSGNLTFANEHFFATDRSSADPEEKLLSGMFENKREAVIMLLLLCGLFVSIVTYFHTKDVIRKEGIAAMALILLLCQIRLISEPSKKQ